MWHELSYLLLIAVRVLCYLRFALQLFAPSSQLKFMTANILLQLWKQMEIAR